MSRPGYVYVASSWRNRMQPAVIEYLKDAGIPAYDFRNPEGGTGFHWSEVGLHGSNDSSNVSVGVDEYLGALQHPRSIAGFDADFAAMEKADTFVLLLPCGRSAHLELGWAVGAGKRTAILLAERPIVPELMYRMVDHLATGIIDLLGWLGAED